MRFVGLVVHRLSAHYGTVLYNSSVRTKGWPCSRKVANMSLMEKRSGNPSTPTAENYWTRPNSWFWSSIGCLSMHWFVTCTAVMVLVMKPFFADLDFTWREQDVWMVNMLPKTQKWKKIDMSPVTEKWKTSERALFVISLKIYVYFLSTYSTLWTAELSCLVSYLLL